MPALDQMKIIKEHNRSLIHFAIAALPGANRYAFGGSDFKVAAAEITKEKFEPTELYGHQSYVTTLRTVGDLIVSGGYDGNLTWFDAAKKQLVRTVEGAHAKWIRKVAVSPDKSLIASVADDMVCRIWDAKGASKVRELRAHAELTPQNFGSMLYAVAFTPDGKTIATGDKTGVIYLWETQTGKQIGRLEAPTFYTWDPTARRHSIGGIRCLAFSPDGNFLSVGGIGKIGNIDHLEGKARVEIFDWKAGKVHHEFGDNKYNGIINHLVFHPKNEWLLGIGGAGDGILLFFDAAGKKLLRSEKVGTHLHDCVVSENGELVTLAGHNRVILFGKA